MVSMFFRVLLLKYSKQFSINFSMKLPCVESWVSMSRLVILHVFMRTNRKSEINFLIYFYMHFPRYIFRDFQLSLFYLAIWLGTRM